MVEHLVYTERVGGSSPSSPTIPFLFPLLKAPHQAHGLRDPGGVGDDLLPLAAAQREQMEFAWGFTARGFATDQATEQIATGGTGDEDVAVQGVDEMFGVEPFAPDVVAAAIVADPGMDGDRDQTRGWFWRGDARFVARGAGTVGVQHGSDGNVGAVGHRDEVRCIDTERVGDAVEPADRDGARAGFQPPDRLCGGGWIAALGDLVEGQALGAADFADGGDHRILH
ncbi:conserved hypothetical protein [Sphingomonas sp. AX6]|nr:conserved hypothetical protein [Sphingomonas sp. AX6]